MTSWNVEKIPNHIGFLILNEDGSVVNSGGELENDETAADVIFNMVKAADKSIFSITENDSGFKRLSINYDDFFYVIAASNKKIHVVKRKYGPVDPASAQILPRHETSRKVTNNL